MNNIINIWYVWYVSQNRLHVMIYWVKSILYKLIYTPTEPECDAPFVFDDDSAVRLCRLFWVTPELYIINHNLGVLSNGLYS